MTLSSYLKPGTTARAVFLDELAVTLQKWMDLKDNAAGESLKQTLRSERSDPPPAMRAPSPVSDKPVK